MRERGKKNIFGAVSFSEFHVEPCQLGGSFFDSLLEIEIQLLQIRARLLFRQHESTVFDASANRVLHAFDVARLDEVVVSAFLQSSDGGFHGSKSGQHH